MMSEKDKKTYHPLPCPFCGKIPHYDEKTELIHCETPECAIGDFYIHMEEWNNRYNNDDIPFEDFDGELIDNDYKYYFKNIDFCKSNKEINK